MKKFIGLFEVSLVSYILTAVVVYAIYPSYLQYKIEMSMSIVKCHLTDQKSRIWS